MGGLEAELPTRSNIHPSSFAVERSLGGWRGGKIDFRVDPRIGVFRSYSSDFLADGCGFRNAQRHHLHRRRRHRRRRRRRRLDLFVEDEAGWIVVDVDQIDDHFRSSAAPSFRRLGFLNAKSNSQNRRFFEIQVRLQNDFPAILININLGTLL